MSPSLWCGFMFERNRIAETLRSAREKQGLSLEQAASAAGIPSQYVRLLEGEENVRIGVSDELYLIPFFRKYARFVGLDAEELLPEFLGVVQQLPGEGAPPIRLAYRSRWGFLWRPLAVLATIAVAVLLLLRQVPERPTFEEPLTEQPSPAVAEAEPTDAATPIEVAVGSEPAVTAIATATIVVTPIPAMTAGPSIGSGAHELRIAAIEEAWLSLALDDQSTKQYLLHAGESRSWNADHFSLTVGNAGGISLFLDGREQGPIGRQGQVVRNLRLPPTAAAVPSAARTPAAE
jgi:cytoskeleton protein RodZ